MWCLKKLGGAEWIVSLTLVLLLQIAASRVQSLSKPIELQMLNEVDDLHVNETLIKPFKNKPQPKSNHRYILSIGHCSYFF